MCHYTHHTVMDAPQYDVHFDVPTEVLNVSLHTSHRYGRSPVWCTLWCPFRSFECVTTHITPLWTLPSMMYTLMSLHIRYTLISLQIFWMCYYTHHTTMDAPQYVHVDVSSGYSWTWKLYYTYHTDMDTPQYVNADEPSDVPVAWMFYYTQHSDMYVPRYVSPGAVAQRPAHWMFPVRKKKGSNNTI